MMGYHERCERCGNDLPDGYSTIDGPCNECLKTERDAAVKILKAMYGKALDGCKNGRIDLSSHIFDMIVCWLRSETKEANIDL